MLKNISWFHYWKFITYILIGYYIVVICIYYYKHIYLIATGKRKLNFNLSLFKRVDQLNQNNKDSNQQSIIDKQEIPAEIALVIDEITNTLYKAGGKHVQKPELLSALQKVLQASDTVINPSYKPAVNEYTKKAAISYCSIHLSDDDLEELWRV